MFTFRRKLLGCALLISISGTVFGEDADGAFNKLDSITAPYNKQSSVWECGKTDALPLSKFKMPQADTRISKSKAALADTLTRQAKYRTDACYISADAAITAITKGGSLVVDVRDPDSFAKYRIASSINMPLHAVRTKSFLKNSPVILVNEGRDTAPLDSACQDLRRAGFSKVSILDGGLNAWRQKFGNLAGDVIAQKDLNKMKPGELFEEAVYSDWLIADFSGVSKSEVAKYWPRSVSKNLANDEKRFLKDYKELVSQRRKGNAHVVLVTSRGEEYDKLSNWLRRAREPEPLFLEGGFEGYKQFTRRQVAIWTRVDNPPRRKGCGTS